MRMSGPIGVDMLVLMPMLVNMMMIMIVGPGLHRNLLPGLKFEGRRFRFTSASAVSAHG